MNSKINFVAPILWFLRKLFLQNAHSRFLKSLEDPAKTQKELLKALVKDLSKTEYGQEYKVLENDTYQEFQSKLPLVSYEDLEKYIHKMRTQNASGILTSKKTLCWETTSGNSGPKKLIPYNRDLLNSFENTFKIWACDLLMNGLNLNKVKIFFSISPPVSEEQIGFKSDFEYLGKLLSFVLKFFVLAFKKAKAKTTLDNFQKELSLLLLREADLEVISIWSPTYFLSLLNYIERNVDSLVRELEPDARILLLKEKLIPWQKIWPNLKLISCWSSAGAAPAAKHLASIFKEVKLQGKGLLCTEAPLTLPFGAHGLCLPLLEEVFFEFLGEDGKIKLVHEVELEAVYELIISQKGGFMRYRNGDKVKVLTKFKSCQFNNIQVPCLEFV
ncbi:MAG: GH3 auxin-responsive promoter family protein, partial [Candidatus Caenarcaniphilales bacterium]|nr:GH3 auxin-responsive promoter family protein [Candidatus Caenarcaniphilales bacterium]